MLVTEDLAGDLEAFEELSKWVSDGRKSKERHLEVSFPGELVGVDRFYIGTEEE